MNPHSGKLECKVFFRRSGSSDVVEVTVRADSLFEAAGKAREQTYMQHWYDPRASIRVQTEDGREFTVDQTRLTEWQRKQMATQSRLFDRHPEAI